MKAEQSAMHKIQLTKYRGSNMSGSNEQSFLAGSTRTRGYKPVVALSFN